MEYIHVKNLEKYHPTYKDRNLLWCKIYFTMLNSDYEFDNIDDVDKWRLIALIMLEIQMKKPIPLDEKWLLKKLGTSKRPIRLSLQMLHNFVECGTDVDKSVCPRTREELEKNKIGSCVTQDDINDVFAYYLEKTKRQFRLTNQNQELIRRRLRDGFTVVEIKRAVDNFVNDSWSGRKDHLELVYCLGVRNKIDNLTKWLGKNNGEKDDRL